jgi:exodeoxyribonuclease VII small subunit
VRELEDTDLPLDKALVLYEEGMKLSEFCHKQLEEADGRVEIMTRKAGGKVVAEPFEANETEAGER